VLSTSSIIERISDAGWRASGGDDSQSIDAGTSLDAGSLIPGLQIDLLEIWQG